MLVQPGLSAGCAGQGIVGGPLQPEHLPIARGLPSPVLNLIRLRRGQVYPGKLRIEIAAESKIGVRWKNKLPCDTGLGGEKDRARVQRPNTVPASPWILVVRDHLASS